MPLAADDTAFRQEGAIISAAWLLGNLAWLLEGALREDGRWGIATRRSRILHYVQAFAEETATADLLPGLHRTAVAWLDQLQLQWPETPRLAAYPAFGPP